MRQLLITALLFAAADTVGAQNSLLFAMDGNEIVFDNANGLVEAGLLREDEVGIVTPGGGTYSASTFLSMEAQWAFLGDADMDDRLVDSSTTGPGDDTDSVFVKNATGAPSGTVGQLDVYYSKEGNAGFDTSTFEDGDVFRYTCGGALETFVTEVQILEAIGQAPTGDVDIDAICQSSAGDLFFSFDLTESVTNPGGTSSADDGGIVYVPSASITYDVDGNVSSIITESAIIIASEADMNALIAASGVATSVGGAPSSSIDITALELDPAGGTWTSPQEPSLTTLPNLLFAWSGFSNDGAILSTAGGGTIASINGVPMGSATATTGTQIGLLPDSTGLGGLMGMALIPQRSTPLVLENYPTNLITSSTILFTQNQVSGATPGGLLVYFVDVGPVATGSVLPKATTPGIDGFSFGLGTFFVLAYRVADAGGHSSLTLNMPTSLVGSGINLAWQVLDLTGLAYGTPGAMQFL